jgi:putative ABC transport system ATP-binding protein
MDILRVEHLSKNYGSGENEVKALNDVSFTMKKGEFAAVVGESGSGKSTLLNCIGALDVPTAGKVFLAGEDLLSLKEPQKTIFRRRNIGFIFQSFQLISELSVEQNIIFPLLLDNCKPDQDRVEEILRVLGLTERRNHLPGQLSGGQQQRVAIGRALITNPMLILADEPTGNLDSKSSQDVIELLVKAARHYQQTILMITHNIHITSSVDRILSVKDGVLTDLGGRGNEKLF